jgi:hypothetical protein
MQPRDEEQAGHGSSVAHARVRTISRASSRSSCATLVGMAAPRSRPSTAPTHLPLLTSRLHVDLQRTSSAVCSPA